MRKLTVRERVLLAALVVIAAISGYAMLFYMPISQRTQALQEQIAQEEALSAQLEERLEEQRQMQRNVEALSAREDTPPRMPEYDNLQAVMVELNDILSDCLEYSLSFQGDDGSDSIFHRSVTIPFRCADYNAAKAVLQRLHDSALRSLLESVQLSQRADGTVEVTAEVTFLEYWAEGGQAPASEP